MSSFQSTPPARGATSGGCGTIDMSRFQSTPPARGATPIDGYDPVRSDISIHAPREGGDPIAAVSFGCRRYFNPRPPRGGRLLRRACYHISIGFQSTPPARGATAGSPVQLPDLVFQSTPPARGATDLRQRYQRVQDISIHAPREGGDGAQTADNQWNRYFNPRPPRGGRHHHPAEKIRPTYVFQSTPPARGATTR